jgi:glutamyl-tRNA synthetase
MGQIMNCLRLCLVGEAKGPHLNDIMAIIGKEETVQRIHTAIQKIKFSF